MRAFTATRLSSMAQLLEASEALGGEAASTPFQRRGWIEPWLATIGRTLAAEECPIVVRDGTGAIAALLPFVAHAQGRIRALSFPDANLSDYTGPILGPAAPSAAEDAFALWRAVRALPLPGDVVRLRKLAVTIAGRPNPLALLPGARPSELFGSRVEIGGSLEAFLSGRDHHFRKEVSRSFRVLEREGPWRLEIPEEPAAALAALRTLEEMQTRRMREVGKDYILDRPDVHAHYEKALLAGLARGTARILAIKVADTTVATIFGLFDNDSLLLLRIANAGEDWKHCSPGRLIVAETMRWLATRGVPAIDMTIGDYSFKRQFKPTPLPLADFDEQLSWRGLAAIAGETARARIRAHPRLKAMIGTLRGGK